MMFLCVWQPARAVSHPPPPFPPVPPHRYTIYKYDKASHTAVVGIASPKAAKLTPKGKEAGVQAVLPEGASGARAGGDTATQAATDDDTPSTTTSTASPNSSNNNEGGIRIGPITLTPRGVRIGPASTASSSADAAAATADPAAPVSRREGKRTSMSDVAASSGKSTTTSLGDMAAAQRG